MKKAYNIITAILALVSIIIAVMDICSVINISLRPYKYIDFCILIFFTADYAVRFLKSKNKKSFFKSNIFDLIAIIPFSSIFSAFRIFRLFRLFKLTKIAKLSKIIRITAFFGVIKEKISGILRTNGFLYVLYANVVMIFLSSFIMMLAEKQSFSDALWWSIVTCTTVGYGDIFPASAIGRIVAVVLMLFGIGLIGMLTGAITTYFTANHKKTDQNDELNDLIKNLDSEQKEKIREIIKILYK